MFHHIYAPVLIRAEHYAAALGLAPKSWRAGPAERGGAAADHIHVLPGVSTELADTAQRNAAKWASPLTDLRGTR